MFLIGTIQILRNQILFYINLFLSDLFDYLIFEWSYSLGICKKKEKLLKTYLPNNFQVTFNVSRFQRLDTNSCGSFVLFFIIQRTLNLDTPYLELINSIFSADPTKNEKKIKKFLSKWNQGK